MYRYNYNMIYSNWEDESMLRQDGLEGYHRKKAFSVFSKYFLFSG